MFSRFLGLVVISVPERLGRFAFASIGLLSMLFGCVCIPHNKHNVWQECFSRLWICFGPDSCPPFSYRSVWFLRGFRGVSVVVCRFGRLRLQEKSPIVKNP